MLIGIPAPGKLRYNNTCFSTKMATRLSKRRIWRGGYQRRGRVGTCVAHVFFGLAISSIVFVFSMRFLAFSGSPILTLSFTLSFAITKGSTLIGTVGLTAPTALAQKKWLSTPATSDFGQNYFAHDYYPCKQDNIMAIIEIVLVSALMFCCFAGIACERLEGVTSSLFLFL